jgi:hypothetical protein
MDHALTQVRRIGGWHEVLLELSPGQTRKPHRFAKSRHAHRVERIGKRSNGTLYRSSSPGSADKPATSSYYQANIVVETNRSLQLFSGGLSSLNPGAVTTDWNQDGSQRKNVYYGGHFSNMGGCMGCHGSQGQNPPGQAGDFSVILAIGSVTAPGVP